MANGEYKKVALVVVPLTCERQVVLFVNMVKD